MKLFSEFFAKRSIEKMKVQRDVSALIKALHDEKYRDISGLIVDALTAIGPPAVGPLIESLKNSSMRVYTARVLGNIGDRQAVEPLIMILSDSDGSAREQAAEALAKIGDTRAIPSLLKGIDPTLAPSGEYSKSYDIFLLTKGTSYRASGYDSDLASILWCVHTVYKVNKKIFGTLDMDSLDSTSSSLILDTHNETSAKPFLKEMYRLEALGRLRSSEAIAPALKWMHSRAIYYIAGPARILRQNRDLWFTQRIRSQESDWSVRTSLPWILKLDLQEPLSDSAARSLSSGDRSLATARQAILSLIAYGYANEFKEDAERCSDILANIGSPAVEFILDLLHNHRNQGFDAVYADYWFVRKHFIEALGFIGKRGGWEERSISFLEEEAKSSDPDVSKAASWSLNKT